MIQGHELQGLHDICWPLDTYACKEEESGGQGRVCTCWNGLTAEFCIIMDNADDGFCKVDLD